MLTLNEFRTTAVWSDDIGGDYGQPENFINENGEEYAARGRVYAGGCYIEAIGDASHMLTIGNDSSIAHGAKGLAKLEAKLYKWAKTECLANLETPDSLCARYMAIESSDNPRECGPTIHAAMARGASAEYFNDNTGGWVWNSFTQHETTRGTVIAIATCDGVWIMRAHPMLPYGDLEAFEEWNWHLCGDDAGWLITSAGR